MHCAHPKAPVFNVVMVDAQSQHIHGTIISLFLRRSTYLHLHFVCLFLFVRCVMHTPKGCTHRIIKNENDDLIWEIFCKQHASAVSEPLKPKPKSKQLNPITISTIDDDSDESYTNSKPKVSSIYKPIIFFSLVFWIFLCGNRVSEPQTENLDQAGQRSRVDRNSQVKMTTLLECPWLTPRILVVSVRSRSP